MFSLTHVDSGNAILYFFWFPDFWWGAFIFSIGLGKDVVHLIHMFEEYGFMALIRNANFVPWADD